MRTLLLATSAAAMLAAMGAGSALAQPLERHARDADKDGVVTLAEARAHGAAMFARMDANSDGVIDAADRSARKAQRFAALDTDRNGEVTAAEMKAHHEAREAAREARLAERGDARAERMASRFAAADTDKSGGLSQAELAAMHAQRGQRGPAADGANGPGGHGAMMHDGMRHGGKHGGHGKRGGGMRMLAKADSNGDKAITRAEFDAAIAARFTAADADKDGRITTAERQAQRQAMAARWNERRGDAATGK